MANTFRVSADIAAPPARVWDVIRDVERWHEWTPSITRVKRYGTGPLAVGSRALVRQPKLLPAFWRVTELEPGRQFTWVSIAPGMRVTGFHGVEPAGTGSRATLSIDYGGPFGRVMARVLRRLTEQYLAFEAAGLRQRSENPGYRL